MTPPVIATVPRDDAVRILAGHIADCTAFLIIIPPGLLADGAHRLQQLPATWTAYLDNATGTVLTMPDPAGLVAVDSLIGQRVAAVVVVPKTTPAELLSIAFDQPIDPDGSRDLILMQEPDGPIGWPTLFVDALGEVDPSSAEAIRAAGKHHPDGCGCGS